MRFLLTVFILMIYGISGIAQSPEETSEELYMPLEFKMAYEKGARATSGKVTSKYWQNYSEYVIDASIDPSTRLLEGKASITYYNNSPDSLRSVTVQAYHDYQKPYAKRKYFFPPEYLPAEEHEGFVIESFAIEGETIDLYNRERVQYGGTNYSIRLKEPLTSKDSLNIQVEWNYIIPKGFVRSGAIDSTSMFVAYWYPEIAVKDDIQGWDRSVYDTGTEFYHDFSNYEVTLNMPDNFVAWASVSPENPEKVYNLQTRERLKQARNSTSAIKIITEEDFQSTSSSTTTWQCKAKNFPDFSFALSDHFVWEASMYKSDKTDVFAHVAYPPDHEEYVMAMPAIHEALDLFHNTMPKYPFPYKNFTIFNGNTQGGMEFPGMANNAYPDPKVIEGYLNREVTQEDITKIYSGLAVHEMAHMYFPFMMGLNEKNYAWMDEGFADFLNNFLNKWSVSVITPDPEVLGSISRTPLMVLSREHEGSWTNSYDFGSAFYFSLYNLLGEESFIEALHVFMDEWKYKHPTPYDMFYSFNRETEGDLTWFFNNWLFDWGYIDLEVATVKEHKIEIRNKGGKAVSFKLILTSKDGETHNTIISPAVWKDSTIYTHRLLPEQELIEVEIEVPVYGDAVPDNNVWEK